MWCIAISVVEPQHIKFGETCSGKFLFCRLLNYLPNKMWVRIFSKKCDVVIYAHAHILPRACQPMQSVNSPTEAALY